MKAAMSRDEAIEAFAALVQAGARAVALTAQAESMPQAQLSQARTALEAMRLERAAALADIAVFAIGNAAALLPMPAPAPAQSIDWLQEAARRAVRDLSGVDRISEPTPDAGIVTYQSPAPAGAANPFLER